MAASACSTITRAFPSHGLMAPSSRSQSQIMPVKWKRPSTIRCAYRRTRAKSRDPGNRLVDESMITLRKRMHEAKLAEHNYEPPADWMDWEKRYYIQYGTDVFELVGLLQALLINTRPSLALAIIALLTISVPTTAILGIRFLIDASGFVLLPLL